MNTEKTGADNFQQIVAKVFAAIEARGYPLDDLGAQTVDEIADELRSEFSSDPNLGDKR